jgi:hypothetical protein
MATPLDEIHTANKIVLEAENALNTVRSFLNFAADCAAKGDHKGARQWALKATSLAKKAELDVAQLEKLDAHMAKLL